jgi:serine/threonine protein kinase/tetratricopeptide (TPR) repeat protein
MTNPATGPLGIGETFGRYHVIRLLGMGGMGAVYHAWDEILGISVALKVIRPDTTSDPAAVAQMNRRFKRELLLARKVTHDNVVRIHDLGELADIRYITMSYVDGEDLATRLKRYGTLPVPAALKIARQIASGLAAAHKAGVVHRDLKPANVMVESNLHASIMDFGIARDTVAPPPPAELEAAARLMAATSVPADGETAGVAPPGDEGATRVAGSSPTSDEGATRVAGPSPTRVVPPPVKASGNDEETAAPTATLGSGATTPTKTSRRMTIAADRQAAMLSMVQGTVMGTMGYMAPEQARGEAVDQRADVYAFGMILSEMLVGRRPAPKGLNAYQALMHRCETEPTSLREVDPAIPEAVDAVVLRCLQLDADKRFASADEIVAEFDRLDEAGVPRPVVRRLTRRMIAAAAVVVVALVGATYWTARRAAPVEHAPMSVLIADFENTTADPALDATVEQSLGIALEGASFITNFPRAAANAIANEIKAPHGIDEATARLIALREGVNVVVAGSIAPRGEGYRIGVKTVDPQGKELASFSANASGKNDVLRVVSQLASQVRDEFGDTTSAKDRQADAETFTAASLDAVTEYAVGQDLASGGKDDDAIAHYQAALAKDPRFGRAYSGWAVSAFKAGRSQEADEAYKKAFSVLDRMTEREKLRTLGGYYLQVAGSYDKAIDNYSQLVSRYPADRGGHSNLAIAHFASLNFTKAVEEGREALKIYPRNVTFHSNVALFALYATDFKAAAEEAARVIELDKNFAKGYLPQAIAAIDRGDFAAARDAYARMAATGAVGASRAASGLADLDLYTGQYKEAERRLRAAITDDENNRRTEGLIAKRVALGDALLAQGRVTDALREAAAIAALADGVTARVPAARILLQSGAGDESVRRIAGELNNQLQPQKRAYSKIIDGEVALARHRAADAVEHFTAARKFTDLWLARFDLGLAYVQAGAYAEAVSELELADKRRGEAMAMFLDDWPTVHQVATLQYWLGRAHEGLGAVPVARQNYQAFMKLRTAPSDPLAKDARERLTAFERPATAR